ncbi:hypothetical protein F4780DRAFT_777745 [Xylariomycetidae sp. FL0641]|nr:hypothetical protein F4780DRAFT_777745 [Xylariomycetidae sp. FL0641]
MAGQYDTYFNRLPVETLKGILDSVDSQEDLIKLAMSQPEKFLSRELHVFVLDVQVQMRLQNADPPVPFTDTLENRPLLYTAIEAKFDLDVVRSIARTYHDICPGSLDGIWGPVPRTFPPAVHFALRLGRVDVATMLIDLGADPKCFSFGYPPEMGYKDPECALSRYPHRECKRRILGYGCSNPLRLAIYLMRFSVPLPPRAEDEAKRREYEDFATMLFKAQASPVSDEQSPALSHLSFEHCAEAKPLEEIPWMVLYSYDIRFAVEAGMVGLVKAFLEHLHARFANSSQEEPFWDVIFNMIQWAAIFQAHDDNKAMLDLLFSFGPCISGLEGEFDWGHLNYMTSYEGNHNNLAHILDYQHKNGIVPAEDEP